jgi:hypothetical protein
LLEFFAADPATLPDLPGRLYESEATRTMDAMLASIQRGRWGTLYAARLARKRPSCLSTARRRRSVSLSRGSFISARRLLACLPPCC